MVLYCVKDHDKGKHLDEFYSYIQEKGTTYCAPRSEHRSERGQERRAAMTSGVLAISLRSILGHCAPALEFAGLLEVQAYCLRPERLASRSLPLEQSKL